MRLGPTFRNLKRKDYQSRTSTRLARCLSNARVLRLEPLEERTLLSVHLLTDKLEYAPEEAVTMTATGFEPGETVEFQISRVDGLTAEGADGYASWQIIDGSQFEPDGLTDREDAGGYDLDGLVDGNVQTTWGISEDESSGGVFEVTATGLTSGAVASTRFNGILDDGLVESPPEVATDKPDYDPGETAIIMASGFTSGETIEFHVLHIDGTPNTGAGHEPWQVADGSVDDLDGVANGNVQTTWHVNEDDSLGSIFEVTATGLTSEAVAGEIFTDAEITVFKDTFDSNTLDCSKWDCDASEVDIDDGRAELDGNDEYLVSNPINLLPYVRATCWYGVQMGGEEDPPESSDHLYVKYRDSNGDWHLIDTISTDDCWNRTWEVVGRSFLIPEDAYHSNFVLKFDAHESDGAGRDDWFIHDVSIFATRNLPPSVKLDGPGGDKFYDEEIDSGAYTIAWSASDPNNNISEDVSAWITKLSTDEVVATFQPPIVNATVTSGELCLPSYPGLGLYKYEVEAVDSRGLSDLDSGIYEIIDDDTTPPEVTLGGSFGTESVGENQQFTWSAIDPQDVETEDGDVATGVTSGLSVGEVKVWHNGSLIYEDDEAVFPGSFDFNTYGLGTFTIEASVSDADSDGWIGDSLTSSPVSRSVEVINTDPIAFAGVNQIVDEGTMVHFISESSFDPDGEPLDFRWDFGDGAVGFGDWVSHIYDDGGTYEVTLTVEDTYSGLDTDTVIVRVENLPPDIRSVSNDGPVASAGTQVTVSVDATDAPADEPLTYEFDFDNDGVFEITNTTGEASHTPVADGVFPVNVRVSDKDGGQATGWTPVQVGPLSGTTPAVSFVATSNLAVSEDAGVVSVEVALTEASPGNIIVPLTVTGTSTAIADYALGKYLLIPAGETDASIEIAIVDDLTDEFDETLTISMETPFNATLGTVTSQTITIEDNDVPPTVSFTTLGQTTIESPVPIVVAARLSAASAKEVVVPLAISGTADDPEDYFIDFGPSIVIPAGNPLGYATIIVYDDVLPEPNQTIILSMLEPTNALLSDLPGSTTVHTITILQNDAPSVSFDAAYRRVTESVGPVNVTARESAAFYDDVDVPLLLSGTADSTDYAVSANPIHFDAYQLEASTTVSVVDDDETEESETIVLEMDTSASVVQLGPTSRYVVEIVSNDYPVVSFEGRKEEVWEDAGTCQVFVTLSKEAPYQVIVPIITYGTSASPEDYEFTETSVVFEPGEVRASTSIAIVDDEEPERRIETVNLMIGDVENARVGDSRSFSVDILDDDPTVSLTKGDYLMYEGGSKSFRVVLSHRTNRDIDIVFAVSGTARTRSPVFPSLSADDLYVTDEDGDEIIVAPGGWLGVPDVLLFALKIPEGSAEERFTVCALDNEGPERSETASFRIYSTDGLPLGEIAALHVTIWDTPVVQFDAGTAFGGFYTTYFSVPGVYVLREDNSIEFQLRVLGESHSRIHVTLAGSMAESSDYSISPRELVIEPGQEVATFTVTANRDDVWEFLEPLNIYIKSVGNNAEIGPKRSIMVCILEYYWKGYDILWEQFKDSLWDAKEAVYDPIEEGVSDIVGSVSFGLAQDGYIDGGTAFFDGNLNFVLDFLDLNGDGVQDPGEPTEPSFVTGVDGLLMFSVPLAFDRNGNGTFDVDEGQIVLTGGSDISTNLSQVAPLIAPVGATVVNPLTTVVACLITRYGFSLEDAQERVLEAFDLPSGIDLIHFDMFDKTVGGDASAPSIVVASAKLRDTVTQITHFVSGLPDAPPMAYVANLVVEDLAAKLLQSGSGLPFDNRYVVQTLLEGVLDRAGLTLSVDVLSAAATIMKSGNDYLNTIPLSDTVDFLDAVASAQAVAQGTVADALALAAAGGSIDAVLADYTGQALADRITESEPGNSLPPILAISDARVVEGDEGQTACEFTVSLNSPSVSQISVDYQTIDLSATSNDGDYSPTSGTLTWEPGDATSRTIQVMVSGDTSFEADESFLVMLDNPVDAAVWKSMGNGVIVNDDNWVYSAPSDGEPNDLEFWMDGTFLQLRRNDTIVFEGEFSRAVPFSIIGAPDVQNSLTVDLHSAGDALAEGLHFQGGSGDNDSVTILVDSAESIVHTIAVPDAGEFHIDSSILTYASVESVSNDVTPTIVGMPDSISPGTEIALTSVIADPSVAEVVSYYWSVTKNGAEFASGEESDFRFTPDGDGSYRVGLKISSPATVNAETTIGFSITEVEDLGSIAFYSSIADLSEGDASYSLRTTRDGVLTIEATANEDGTSVDVRLYDADGAEPPLAISAPYGNIQRIDYSVQAGERYHFTIDGDSTAAELTIANLVATEGTEIQVSGTAADDTFEFVPTGSYLVTINGVEYHFNETQYETIVFTGSDGDDTATLTGGAGDEIARFFPDHGTFGENGFLVTVNDVVEITAHGGGGLDAAFLYDSPGDDEFIARKGYGKLSGDGFALETFDFMTNYGYATTRDGGNDVAYMEDSPEKDKFKFDWPKAGQFFGKMYGGGIYYNRAKNFEQIEAVMTEGKNTVRLFDSEGDDTFYGQKEESRLVGDGFDVTVGGYESLIVYASTGNDIVHLEDSVENDTTRARPHKIVLWGGEDANPTYTITARKFDEYHFKGKHGGYDRAKLHDTTLSDHAEASGDSVSLYANNGELDLLYEVVAFDWVKLYGSEGQDTVKKENPLDFDLVYDPAMWDELP